MTSSSDPTSIAGRPDGPVHVRHLVVGGTDEAIGWALADHAITRLGAVPVPSSNPELTRARRVWFRAAAPRLAGRARGAAQRFEVDPDDDLLEWASIPLGMSLPSCSVGWIPPTRTATGSALLTRAFDFTTMSLAELLGLPAVPGQSSLAGQPHVVHTTPADGPANTAVVAFDLLSGATEGINEAGLVVALLADQESSPGEPTFDAGVGLGEHEVCRHLLDHCTTAAEAAIALRTAKHYYAFVRAHYVVADALGNAFVWERSEGGNHEYLTWFDDLAVVANHLHHRHPDVDALPSEPGPGFSFDRTRTLRNALASQPSIGVEGLADAHAAVRVHLEEMRTRTLWHSAFDLAARTMTVSFYLGDRPDGTEERSTPFTFTAARTV